MIFGITGGTICAGRSTFADYLVDKYGFIKIDVFQEYMKTIESVQMEGGEAEQPISNSPDGI